jgi:phosphohistidine phosphatase
MRLYLVQHGEAVPEDVDPARPLSETGRADVAKVARFLAAGGLRVDQVLHSGKLRAEQTAALLAAALAPGRTPLARPGLNPKDPTDEVAKAVTASDQDAMLVGHLPFMARLASRLLAGRDEADLIAFQPGTIVCLERDQRQRWTIAWMVRPGLVSNQS